MKPPSKLPDVSLKTPLASGMAHALTSVPDLLLLLQQQADLLANQQQENSRLNAENERLKSLKADHKYIQSLEAEIKQLKLTIAHHGRMRNNAIYLPKIGKSMTPIYNNTLSS